MQRNVSSLLCLLPLVIVMASVPLGRTHAKQLAAFPIPRRNIDPGPRVALGPSNLAKVVNGYKAEMGQFPWQVSIRAALGRSVTVCGGSVIDTQWILTAAHCAKDYQVFQIGFGSVQLNVPLLTMSTLTKFVHPAFDPVRLTNDIAVIRLPTALSYSREIQPIRLPPTNLLTDNFANRPVLVSGFGRTSDASQSISTILKFQLMKVVPNGECSNVYSSSVIKSTTLCAIGAELSNQNVCQGDSGGPLVANIDGAWVQIGIVSFVSSRGCSTGDPSGYTRTAAYLDWLTEVTGLKHLTD